MATRRVSYEIVPGATFRLPPGLARSSFATLARAQQQADRLFRAELLERLGLTELFRGSEAARGGWQGGVNPSTQLLFDPEARRQALGAYAAALGLIWRQDAVAVSFLHPDGERIVVRLRRSDGKPLTGAQMQRFYRRLHEHDPAKQATIGFTEHDGAMLFVNLGRELSDKQFSATLVMLAEQHLAHDVDLDFLRADFELESTDWSNEDGEGYRQRLREAGRPDLLDWVENVARPQAERFLAEFDWHGRPRHGR